VDEVLCCKSHYTSFVEPVNHITVTRAELGVLCTGSMMQNPMLHKRTAIVKACTINAFSHAGTNQETPLLSAWKIRCSWGVVFWRRDARSISYGMLEFSSPACMAYTTYACGCAGQGEGVEHEEAPVLGAADI
jgi:hypothetical protein